MSTLTRAGDVWTAAADPARAFRSCANAEVGACNWVTPASDEADCAAPAGTIELLPDLGVEANVVAWRKIERAKRYLFYSLTRLRLPLPLRRDNDAEGLAFDFFPARRRSAAKVTTGHDNGLITLDIAEADDAQREARRTAMREPYRTLLGHFRHEIGHFYWDLLVRDGGKLDAFRAMFGDERADYQAALQAHYQMGRPPTGRRATSALTHRPTLGRTSRRPGRTICI